MQSIWEEWISKCKVVAFDLDETLICTNGKLYDGVLEGVKFLRDCGLNLVIVTGRTIIELQHLTFSDSFLSLFDPNIICHDGDVIYDIKTGDTKTLRSLDSTYLEELLTSINPYTSFSFEKNGRMYANTREAAVKSAMLFHINRSAIKLIENIDCYNLSDIPIMYFFPEDEHIFEDLYKREGLNMKLKHSGKLGMIKLLPKHQCKSFGLKYLLENKRFKLTEVIAVGNGENDVSLFGACKYGAAVRNSVKELIAVADIHLTEELGDFLQKGRRSL
ncbi:HAD-IIB family hydrolase [Bacillus cereus]|nr:HAD-IIB family hydrolase [Bacillus cereus]